MPVFEVAKVPGTPTCSDLNTGAPGQSCNQATFTTAEDQLQIVGGTNTATGGLLPVSLSLIKIQPSGKLPSNHSGVS